MTAFNNTFDPRTDEKCTDWYCKYLQPVDHPPVFEDFLSNDSYHDWTLLEDSILEGEEAYTYGPPSWIHLLVQIFYGLVFIIGLAGNSLVIYVSCRFAKMKTVKNVYIFNLAIADVFFCLGIPLLITTAVLGNWPFGKDLCKIYFVSTSIQCFTRPLFLLIMTADRYLALCHPKAAKKLRTKPFVALVSIFVWILSGFFVTPIYTYSNTLEIDTLMNCNIFWPEWDGISGEIVYVVYTLIIGFAVPFVLSLPLCILIIWRLRNPKSFTNRSVAEAGGVEETRQALQENRRTGDVKKFQRRATKLLLIVVAVHFLLAAPYWATQMALMMTPYDSYHSDALLIILLLAGCLSYLSSALNPILYGILSDNFKNSFKKAFSCGRSQSTISFNSISDCEDYCGNDRSAKDILLVNPGKSVIENGVSATNL